MKKIALVIPWFGKLKNYNSFWFKSIEYNPTVDFFLITDQNVGGITPNLTVVKTTFEDVVADIQANFDFKVCIPQSYKLCDFKVAYGEVFSALLNGYDFWGHCDNDLIFGDIREFITEDVLEKNDRILSRGHFTLYRNTPNVNAVYKKASPDYRMVFSSPKNFCFDEWPGTSRYWRDYLNDKFYDAILYDDIHYLKHAFVTVHKKELDKGRKNFVYLFDKGKLYRYFEQDGRVCNEPTMYVHFQKRSLRIEGELRDTFAIVPNTFLPAPPQIGLDFLRKYGKKKLFYSQYFKIKFTALKRKLRCLITSFSSK